MSGLNPQTHIAYAYLPTKTALLFAIGLPYTIRWFRFLKETGWVLERDTHFLAPSTSTYSKGKKQPIKSFQNIPHLYDESAVV